MMHLIFKTIIVLGYLLGTTKGTGNLYIDYEYFDTRGRDSGGDLCDYCFLFCYNPCDPVFDICLRFGHTTEAFTCSSSNIRSPQIHSGEYVDNDKPYFGSSIGGTSNPVHYATPSWFNGLFEISIIAKDEDGIYSGDDDIDHVLFRITASVGTSYSSLYTASGIRGSSPTTAAVRYLFYCDTNYYGSTCGVYCLGRDDTSGHYYCNHLTGAIICYTGYAGSNCDVGNCGTGYEWNVALHSCVDINECSIGTSNCEQSCINNDGSYTCSCSSGYQLYNSFFCHDINECGANPCAGTCTNIIGSYQCACGNGYRVDSTDMTRCNDIDECQESLDNCDHNCVNSPGSFYCGCRSGYVSGSGGACNDIDECALDTDQCDQLCTNTMGSYTCDCTSNYYLSSTYTCSQVNFSVVVTGTVLSSTSIRLAWTTDYFPSSNPVSLSYQVWLRDVTFSTATSYANHAQIANNLQIYATNLLPYRRYQLYISAVGGIATNDSNIVTVRTNEDSPSTGPSHVDASALNATQIRVHWSAPSTETQNGILTTYTLQYTTSQQRQMNGIGNEITVFASITSYILTGLSAYTEYWLSVAASTSVGRGPYTNRSSAVRTYESIPTAAPGMTVASKTSTSITLTLQPPTNTALINGVITYYSVSFTGINVDTSTTNLRVTPSSGNYLSPVTSILSPLQEGVSYNIEASMYTSVGGGPSSSILTVTTQESVPADTPQNIQFTSVQTTSLSLSWDPPPLMDRNGVILGYRLSYRGVSVDTQVMVRDTVNSYATLSNLVEGSAYTIDIWARNSAGNGPSVVTTTSTIEIAPNGSPRDFVGRSNSPTSISLTWLAPSAENQNGIITGYQIELVGRGYDTSTYLIDVIGTVRSHTIHRLENGHSYQVSIRSRNSVGLGPATNIIIISTRESAPGTPPENFQALQGRTWISLMWNPPRVAEQNGNITEYEIEYSGTNVGLNNGSFYTQALTTNISSLEQYEFYRIRIRAYTAIGPGPFSSQLAVRTLQDAPSAPPRSVQLNAVSSTQISLRWQSPPISDQNGVLTGFKILIASDYNAFSRRVSVSGTDSEHLFMNLHPYVNYSVQVQAETSPGLGPYSTAITVETHQAAPSGTPLRVETTSFLRSIALQWEPPIPSEQNGIITGYLVIYRGLEVDTEIKNLTTSSIVSRLENLHPGNDYQISLCAYTFVGVGPCLTFTNSTISIPPSEAPRNVTVNASGSTSLLISWEPPETIYRNGILTGFTIITTGKGHDSSVNRHYVGPNLRSFTIDNLEEGHYYDISISAENKAGSGPFTKNYTISTNEGAPSSAPQNLHGNSTQTSIFVSWNAPPAPDHNGQITQYELSYEGTSLDASSNYSIYETELRAVLNNLHVNEIYQIRVRAFTSFGTGPYSTAILIRTLESRPTAAPERVNLISDSDTQITVNWDNPALADQNGVLTGFDLNLVSEDNSYQDDASVTASRQTYSFTNLHPYTSYVVRVRAITQPGPGPYSLPLTVLTQQAAPTGPPRNIQAIISSNTISFSWDAPEPSLQNGIIVGYQVTYQGTAVDTNETVITTTNNTATLTDLEEGAEYSIQVCAVTVSIGPCIQWMNFTSETIPTGVPTNVQIQAITATTITISWEAPILTLRNGILTGYEVIAVGQQHDTNEYKTRLNGNMLSFTFENLEESHDYIIKLRAINAIGFGPFTTIVTILTLEAATGAAPLNLTANSTETTITLHWNPPPIQYQNGILRYYEIEYYSTSDFLSIEQKVANVSASQSTITIENLQESAEFQFKVRAYTSIGPGPYSSEITVTTKPSEPSSAPTNLQALSLTSTQIQVIWDPPSAIDQNGPITQYQIFLSPSSSRLSNTIYTTSQTTHTINALHPYTRYSVQVRAENSVGAGPNTSSVSVTTRQAIPSAPPTHLTLVSATHSSANISWRSPMADSLNGPLQGYTLNVTNTLTSTSFIETAATSHTLLDSLTPNTRYSLIVAAVNSQGIGPYTSELFFSTQQSSPTQPPHITQISDDSPHSISLQWNAILAHFQNGPILSYTVNISTSEDDLLVFSQTVLHPTTTATFTNLHPYTEYTLAVSGNNAAGTSPSDYRAHTTEEDSPTGAPTSLSAVPSFTSITLSWQPPNVDLHNGIIIEYSIRFQSSNYVTNTTEYVITSLEEFTMFQWSVAARTSIGIGPYSDTQTVSTLANPPSQPPQNIRGIALSYQSIFVSWDPIPILHQNGRILNCIVYFQMEGEKDNELKQEVDSSEMNTTLSPLKPFQSYSIYVVCENTEGSSPESSTISVMTLEGSPSAAPTDLVVASTSSTSARVSWVRIPPDQHNGILVYYEIVYQGQTLNTAILTFRASVNQTSAVLVDLHPAVEYTVYIRAFTQVGNGPNSPIFRIALPESIPNASPTFIESASQSDSIFLTWSPVNDIDQNGIIIIYELRYSLDNGNSNENLTYRNVSTASFNTTFTDLMPNTYFEFEIRAFTNVGPGPYSSKYFISTKPHICTVCDNGFCVQDLNDYSCECNPGYLGETCSADINDCITNGCEHGICKDGINQYTCECNSGYKGQLCDILSSTPTCSQEVSLNFEWPETAYGSSATLPCSDFDADLYGEATRACDSVGIWSLVDLSQCKRKLFDTLDEFTMGPGVVDLTPGGIVDFIQNRLCNGSFQLSGPPYTPGEMDVLVKLINELISEIERQDKTNRVELIERTMPGVLCVLSNVLDVGSLEIFLLSNATQQAVALSDLIERIAKLNAQNFNSTSPHPLLYSHENLQMFVAPLTNEQSATIPDYELAAAMDTGLYPDSVNIPESEVSALFSKANGDTPVIALVFSRYLGQALGSPSMSSFSSRVITLQSSIGNPLGFTSPITLTFTLFPVAFSPVKSKCVYWDVNTEDWSSSGLNLESEQSDQVSCSSVHATSFAILSSQSPVLPIASTQTNLIFGVGAASGVVLLLISAILCCFLIMCLCRLRQRKKKAAIEYSRRQSHDGIINVSNSVPNPLYGHVDNTFGLFKHPAKGSYSSLDGDDKDMDSYYSKLDQDLEKDAKNKDTKSPREENVYSTINPVGYDNNAYSDIVPDPALNPFIDISSDKCEKNETISGINHNPFETALIPKASGGKTGIENPTYDSQPTHAHSSQPMEESTEPLYSRISGVMEHSGNDSSC